MIAQEAAITTTDTLIVSDRLAAVTFGGLRSHTMNATSESKERMVELQNIQLGISWIYFQISCLNLALFQIHLPDDGGGVTPSRRLGM